MKQPREKSLGLKVMIFWLHYITMDSVDIKFPNKEAVTTQVFAFSRLRKQTPKPSSGYELQTKHKMRMGSSLRFYMYRNRQTWLDLQAEEKKITEMTLSLLPSDLSTTFTTVHS